ncbi:MAG: bifunctional folylpolyglutamate synthase/dihydrofolate synthase [Beijerinckiaceae bacterium]|jgi:dihydrofolate synthase/folylpolyglutamate synthase|nr:bifunctional folylpolyglutamate synthase/dihydrofolate synthase [Beijerinckiaceae bacterium]
MTVSSDALIARFLALHPKAIDLSLGRVQRLLEALGSPHRRLPPIIHVAGTNGKGSTVAFMRAILEAAGLSVHVYTSPHLVRFHERIRLGRPGGGRFVDEGRLVEALARCEAANAGAPITVFEITMAAAFLLFHDNAADVLLLEVGLGGRFDATNVIDHPAAAIVTSIGMDHAEYLGDTLAKIAAEKAGIFKRGAPAVIAPQTYTEADEVLVAEAERLGAGPIWVGGQEFSIREEAGRLVYQDEERLLDLPLPRLLGRHQHLNAATAIAGLRAAGYDLANSIFETGLGQADWPARMQRIARGRLADLCPPGAELWLDGGHNPDGGRVLAAAMADLHDRNPAPLVMIVGMLGTKDTAAVLKPFAGLARELFAVPIPGQQAARTADDVAGQARSVGLSARPAGSVPAALEDIAQRTWPTPPRILICGSLYLAGEVLGLNGTPPT